MSNERRARCPWTSAQGKKTSDIAPSDYPLALRRLIADPRFVLGLFQNSNLGYVGELRGWDRLKKRQPEVAAHILAIAKEMGIPEKPENPKKRK